MCCVRLFVCCNLWLLCLLLVMQVVVLEMHQLVANPELQVQLVEYAQQACELVPSLADSCKADVDQYAPMVFGMILAYLQPDQVSNSATLHFAFVLQIMAAHAHLSPGQGLCHSGFLQQSAGRYGGRRMCCQ